MHENNGFYVNYDRLVTGELSAVRQEGATSGAGVLATYAYDQLGRRTGVTRGNGTSTSTTFDAVSRLASLSHDLASTADDVSRTFAYNKASQIASVTRDNDAYAFGAFATAAKSYTVNGLNQATAAAGVSLTYDARGNTATIGGASYGYSSENLLVTAPGSVTLDYDPLNRLYTTSAGMRFRYDGADLIGEYDSSGVLQKRYVHGDGTDEPLVEYTRNGSGTYDRNWLHADERGSIVAHSDGSGAKTAINAYDEYGVPDAGNTGRFQYTGQTWLPEIGMYYYKARIYAPELGRFLQTDPIGYADGLNWYNYVGSDPVNATDASGMDCNVITGEGCDDPEIVATGTRGTCGAWEMTDPITGLCEDGEAVRARLAAQQAASDSGGGVGASPRNPCLATYGLPSTCTPARTPKPDPRATARRNRLACRLLHARGYNAYRAWQASLHLRDPDGSENNWSNPDYRNAENFLYAVTYGPYKWEVWGRQWLAKPAWQLLGMSTSAPSVDAAQAGYDGTDKYGSSRAQLREWCNDKR